MEDKKHVIVRPVVRKKPFVNADKFGKNKLQGAGTTVTVYLDRRGLHTGLTKEEEKEFEGRLRLKEGSLEASLNNPFWDDFTIKLEDEPNTFDPLIAEDALKIKVLKAHVKVANSLDEITPDTDFYIEDVEEQISKKAKTAETKEEAYRIFSSLTDDDKRKVLKLYGKGGSDLTDKAVKAELMDELEDNPTMFISNATIGKDELSMKSFVFDLHDFGVIRKRGEIYFDGDTSLGGMDSFARELLMPDKREVYEVYKTRLEQAKFGRS